MKLKRGKGKGESPGRVDVYGEVVHESFILTTQQRSTFSSPSSAHLRTTPVTHSPSCLLTCHESLIVSFPLQSLPRLADFLRISTLDGTESGGGSQTPKGPDPDRLSRDPGGQYLNDTRTRKSRRL